MLQRVGSFAQRGGNKLIVRLLTHNGKQLDSVDSEAGADGHSFVSKDIVTGEVDLTVVTPIKNSLGVRLGFFGFEATRIVDNDGFKQEDTNMFIDMPDLRLNGGDQSKVFNKDEKHGYTIAPGRYVYSFTLMIPLLIPCTFHYPPVAEGKKLFSLRNNDDTVRARLEYELHATVEMAGGKTTLGTIGGSRPLVANLPLIVVGKFFSVNHMNQLVNEQYPTVTSEKGFLLSSGKMKLAAKIDRMGYFLGDKVSLSVEVDNTSSKSGTEIAVVLVRRITIWANNRKREKEQPVVTWSFPETIPSGDKFGNRYELRLPDEMYESIIPKHRRSAVMDMADPTAPTPRETPRDVAILIATSTEVNVGKIIQAEYELHVAVANKGKVLVKAILEDIIIAHKPKNTNDNANN